MSNPRLPREIFDYTVDLLHDEPDTLKRCCLVSRSWVPRTRKHLFANIRFYFLDDLEAWKETFPDPANSPAHHTYSLYVGCPEFVTVADVEEGGWVRTFTRVVHLGVHTRFGGDYGPEVSLVPFHNFSPVLKSLRVFSSLPRSHVFNLVCSLPLLEDLAIREVQLGEDHYDRIDFQPLTSPPLTGTFELDGAYGTGPTARRLLDLPGGFHFRKLVFIWRKEEDLRWITALVIGCSDTLECFDIQHIMDTAKHPAPIDFSKATRLKDIIFQCGKTEATWIVMALGTITSKHRDLQQITINVPYYFNRFICEPVSLREAAGEAEYRRWMDLDTLLVQLSESHAIRTKVVYLAEGNEVPVEESYEYVGGLLPKIVERGAVKMWG